MGQYSYDPYDRYRKRTTQRMVRFGIMFVMMAALGGIGFWLGQLQSRQQVRSLMQERETLQQDYVVLQEEVTRLRAEAQTANIRFDQLRAGYEEILPEGPLRELALLLKEQIDKGINAGRLKSVIMAAQPPQNCSAPETRNFVVMTPAYRGPDSQLTVDSAGIVISGKGQPARNEQGGVEAWFDPAKAVNLTFTSGAGAQEVKEGYLPLYHTVVHKGREYRFTIDEGPQSFAKVTFDSCDYP